MKNKLGTLTFALVVGIAASPMGAHAAETKTAAKKHESPFQAGRPALTTRPDGSPAIIRTMADALGMVRFPLIQMARGERTDYINRLQWNAKGSVAGPNGLVKADYTYVLSLKLKAAREDIRPVSGARIVRVVHGDQAWNETAPGVSGSWANDQARLRQLQLARTPFGFATEVLKAAPETAQVTDPGPGGTVTIALTINGVPTIAALDPDYRPSSIKMTLDGQTIEALYSDYVDPDHYGVMFPGHIIEKVGGRTTLDVNVSDVRVAGYAVFPPPAQP
jgi:hypothetical protein